MTTIQDATDKELQDELERRVEAKRLDKTRKHEAHVKLLLSHVHELLQLVPEHSRTSCSDDNSQNGDRGCVRCALITLREDEYFPYYLKFSTEKFNPEEK